MKYFLTIVTYLRIKYFKSIAKIIYHFHLTVQFSLITYTLSLQQRFQQILFHSLIFMLVLHLDGDFQFPVNISSHTSTVNGGAVDMLNVHKSSLNLQYYISIQIAFEFGITFLWIVLFSSPKIIIII